MNVVRAIWRKWKFPVMILGLGLGWVLLSARAELSTEEARQKLQSGALLIDVRTPAEFGSRSLPGAINVPVDAIQSGITNHVTNKSQAVLLHCRSGRRSAIAEKELRTLGYTNVFNIGSFERAEKVVSAGSGPVTRNALSPDTQK